MKQYIHSKIIIDKNGCWNYQGALTENGYARIRHDYAHRVSYETFTNKIPYELTIDHLCSNRKCVNPEHLEAVTIKVNILRGKGSASINSKKTHCIRGHSFSGNNLLVYAGKRQCRICLNKAQLKRYHKKRNK